MHILRNYAAYKYFSEKQFSYQIATPRSHTVGHGCTRSDITADGRTSWHRHFAWKSPYTVEHGRTRLHIRPQTVAQNLFLPHTVAQTTTHGRTHERTWSQKIYFYRTRSRRRAHTVAQKILSCQNDVYPLLRTQAAKKIVSSLVTFLHCTKKEDSICSWVEFLYATLAINSCHLYSYFVEGFPGVKHLKST